MNTNTTNQQCQEVLTQLIHLEHDIQLMNNSINLIMGLVITIWLMTVAALIIYLVKVVNE